jgi:hypothetical protein
VESCRILNDRFWPEAVIPTLDFRPRFCSAFRSEAEVDR